MQAKQVTSRPVIANHGHWNPASAHRQKVFNHFLFGLLQNEIEQHSISKRIAGRFATNSPGECDCTPFQKSKYGVAAINALFSSLRWLMFSAAFPLDAFAGKFACFHAENLGKIHDLFVG
jgi:hypothetical protein